MFIAGEILAADANEAMQMKNSIAKNASVDRFVEEEEENIVILFLLVVCVKLLTNKLNRTEGTDEGVTLNCRI